MKIFLQFRLLISIKIEITISSITSASMQEMKSRNLYSIAIRYAFSVLNIGEIEGAY